MRTQLSIIIFSFLFFFVNSSFSKLEKASTEVVLVQGGTFKMGDTVDGSDEDDERPVHEVTVKSFYIGKFEVTFADYEQFCTETERMVPPDGGYGKENRPVINTSWFDAVEFCNWLSKKEGLSMAYTTEGATNVTCNFSANGYRLPTEAEWEYAAKGGNKSKNYVFSGSNSIKDVGWYTENADGKTQSGGGKSPNELGIFDMTGNVWEWCWDWYERKYYAASVKDNPTGPKTGTAKVLRGGAWFSDQTYSRTSERFNRAPDIRFNYGFRVCRTAL
jgi:formylglycine-generating enzyme required for sulfatase activity